MKSNCLISSKLLANGMLQVMIIAIILGLNSVSYGFAAINSRLLINQKNLDTTSIVQKVFPTIDYEKLTDQFNSWEFEETTSLVGEWKFILYSLNQSAKQDLWWVTSVEERVTEKGFRNNFDGSEFNILSISPKFKNTCDGPFFIEIRNILYSGLNQGPHCVHSNMNAKYFEFQQHGTTPSLDWKTDAWYQYRCRKKQFDSEMFMLCQISIDGDWVTGDTEWNVRVQKWLGINFSYFGFWKKKIN